MHEAMLACPQNPFMRDIRPDAAIVRRSAAQLALAGYAVFFAIFFSPVLISGRVLAPVDGFRFHYPHYWLPRALWDPNLASWFTFLYVRTLTRCSALALVIFARIQAAARRGSSDHGDGTLVGSLRRSGTVALKWCSAFSAANTVSQG